MIARLPYTLTTADIIFHDPSDRFKIEPINSDELLNDYFKFELTQGFFPPELPEETPDLLVFLCRPHHPTKLSAARSGDWQNMLSADKLVYVSSNTPGKNNQVVVYRIISVTDLDQLPGAKFIKMSPLKQSELSFSTSHQETKSNPAHVSLPAPEQTPGLLPGNSFFLSLSIPQPGSDTKLVVNNPAYFQGVDYDHHSHVMYLDLRIPAHLSKALIVLGSKTGTRISVGSLLIGGETILKDVLFQVTGSRFSNLGTPERAQQCPELILSLVLSQVGTSIPQAPRSR